MLLYIVIAADVLIGLFALIGLIQSFRKKTRVGCWSNFLLFIAIAMFLASFIIRTQQDEVDPLVTALKLGGVAGLIILGILFILLDRRQEQYQSLYSRGVLSVSTGLLLLGSMYFVPIVPTTIFMIPTATLIADGIQRSNQVVSNIVPTEASINTPTLQIMASPTITNTPLPSPSPTRTRRAYIPPTSTPTPAFDNVSEECDALVMVNLNVREQPDLDAKIIAIVPEGTFINILGKNDDSTWWLTEFEGERGWVFTDLIEPDPICSA